MDEDWGYRSIQSPGAHVGWGAGILYFAAATTAPFGALPVPDDCFGCGPPRNPILEWAIFLGVALALAIAFGLAARSIHEWLSRRRKAGPNMGIEPPGLAISTAIMLLIFLGIWVSAFLWR